MDRCQNYHSPQRKSLDGDKVIVHTCTNLPQNEVRQRYLFAIEDPFEVDHNVARPVTHMGIVALRDEFRRAWRILLSVGNGRPPEGDLFASIVEAASIPAAPAATPKPHITDEPPVEKQPVDILPGLADLTLSARNSGSTKNTNAKNMDQNAFAPPHLRGRQAEAYPPLGT
jgi:hypothetical protein